ncbi:amidase family protein [Paenibacillus filicis]|uniref:Amidase family protein n=1 Tax=Paenibacillus gyeongsangnamensis TaxID=3388067 RepID=A0ABT4Q501_9BACL|nr:amidase family protein [Paenibacillus filicis]MCZ8511882.1 amidase family protein [Paenibacillus filicis]
MKPFYEATIEELQQAMEEGSSSSLELVQQYMERIAQYDRQGPCINSVLELNPDALHLAEAADAERRQGNVWGPFHGIPVLLKDNIQTADRMHTSAGSIALAGHYAREDAFLVKRLREAGAILLGKTNMTEWANYMTDGMPGGYSSRGGQVLNPYGAEFPAGGSSTGSGAAVAAGFAAASVGTETSGSILSPAINNSVVGIKPTLGLISRSGIVPLAHSQDTAGPLARTVADAALLLGILCGKDREDASTGASAGREVHDYRVYLDKDGLKGARIGIPRRVYHQTLRDEERERFEGLLREIADAGAELVDPADIATAEELNYRSEVFRHEFKADLNAYLSKLPPELPVRSLRELIAFNEAHTEQALKYGQVKLEWAEETTGTLTEPRYILDRLKDLRLSREEGIDAVLKRHRLDALLFPRGNGDAIAAKAGYPSIALPAGYLSSGKPFGVMFTGTAFAEPVLIKLAYAFEQLRPRRKTPAWD